MTAASEDEHGACDVTDEDGTARVPAPGSPEAVDAGCTCPMLANASYRVGAEPTPLIDPTCPAHRP